MRADLRPTLFVQSTYRRSCQLRLYDPKVLERLAIAQYEFVFVVNQ